MGRALLAFGAAVCLAASLRAQSNDHVYRGWRWEEDPGSPRATGLAGAFVAVADDASAALLNPAGLADHARTEVMGTMIHRRSGTLASGDTLSPATGPGLVGGTLAIGSRFAVGAHWGEPHDTHLTLVMRPLPNSTFDLGFLDAQMRSLAFAAGYAPTRRLRVGAGLVVGRLELQGQNSVFRVRGDELTTIDASGSETALRGVFGALYDVTDSLRVGLSARTGATWDVARTAYSPAEGRTVDHGSLYRHRAPAAYSAAAALRVPGSVRLTAQVDLVRHSQILESLDVRRGLQPSDYVLDDGIDGRLGLEWAHAFPALTLQLRAGVANEAPATIAYDGQDATERSTFEGSPRRWRAGGGGSVLLKSGLSLDAAALFGGDRTLLLAGARYRF
jgi:hypothetical protein